MHMRWSRFTCRAGNQMWGSSLDEYLAIDTSEHMGQLARALRNGAVLAVGVACSLSWRSFVDRRSWLEERGRWWWQWHGRSYWPFEWWTRYSGSVLQAVLASVQQGLVVWVINVLFLHSCLKLFLKSLLDWCYFTVPSFIRDIARWRSSLSYHSRFVSPNLHLDTVMGHSWLVVMETAWD